MGIDDLLSGFGDDTFDRIKDVVELVDGNRDELLGAVGFISNHGDDLLEVVEFVREHGDSLIDLVRRLPELMERAGQALSSASEAAVSASGFLTAGDGTDIHDVASSAAGAIDACREHLGSVAGLLERIGEELADIKVPTIDFDRSEVMGLSVVTGLDVGSKAVAAGTAGDVARGAAQLADVVEALGDAGEGLQRLHSNLSSAGDKIASLAGDMDRSGVALMAFADGGSAGRVPRKKPTKKTAKKSTRTAARTKPKKKTATKRKPAAKKPATKKKPAGKKPATKTRASAKRPATTKKSTTKRTSTKRPATTKKPATKRATTKKPATKRPATKRTTAKRTGPGGGVLKRG